jgi:hypothetical protein
LADLPKIENSSNLQKNARIIGSNIDAKNAKALESVNTCENEGSVWIVGHPDIASIKNQNTYAWSVEVRASVFT